MNPQSLDTKSIQACRTRQVITADASQEVPTRIEVIKSGVWPNGSNKGALEITADDLKEFVLNFNAGVGMPRGLNKMPIDYAHEDDKKAAGWITSLEVDSSVHADEQANDTQVLYANVKWTPAGRQALLDEEYVCFSPSFWPGCRGEWHDSEYPDIKASNVLVGAGLTNIPFFKGLKSIMASNGSNTVMYVSESIKENNVPTLDEVRIKDVSSLTADDKKVLADNQSSLSDAEKTKYGFKVEASAVTGVSDEDKAILASIKDGSMKMVKSDELDSLKASVTALEAQNKQSNHEKVVAAVEAEFKLGKIKTDQKDTWIEKIEADATMLDLLKTLPEGKIAASTTGSGEETAVTASQTVREKANELIKAAKDNGQELRVGDAYAQVFASDRALEAEYNNEMRGVN